MNTHYLVKYEGNWADEMDIAGFQLYSKEEWDNLKKDIKKLDKELTFSVGTNEEVEYSNGSDLLTCIKAIAITTEKYELLTKLFPDGSFGETSVFDNIDYYINPESEEDD